jgi:hypothetical protein
LLVALIMAHIFALVKDWRMRFVFKQLGSPEVVFLNRRASCSI